MRCWPNAFEFDYKLHALFNDACDCLVIYQLNRNQWNPPIDKPTADFIWSEAKRLLNMQKMEIIMSKELKDELEELLITDFKMKKRVVKQIIGEVKTNHPGADYDTLFNAVLRTALERW